MGKVKISEQIINKIQEECGDDKVMNDFLISLIYDEAEHTGNWWWRDTYKKRISLYTEKRE